MLNKPHYIIKKISLSFLLFFLLSASANSQSYNKNGSFKSYWQINVSGGTSLFFGDIKQYQFWPVSNYENEWKLAGGLQLIKQVSPVFGIRGQALYGQLSGTRRDWNRYFESDYIEFNLNTTISVRNIISKYNSRQFWDAYFIIGIGITNYNTKVFDLTTKEVVQEVGNGNGKSFGGRTLEGILTGGLGLDFRLSEKWNMNLETANRIMNSDEMDGRVSGFIYDVYNYTSIGLSYKFGIRNTSKKTNSYSYFAPKNKDIKEAEYDYYSTSPIEPPEVDALVIEPIIVPTIANKEVLVIEETPVVIGSSTETGISYRVQIRAKYGRIISIQHLSNIYNIPVEQIRQNIYNGYYIYTIGSFTSYDQARLKRNYLRMHNGIVDAFVVTFKNGYRINNIPQ